jgi:tetratricopeptide (TPR) repeat protein
LLLIATTATHAADPSACFAPDIDQGQRYAGCSATANDAGLPAGVRANAFVTLAEIEAARGQQTAALKDYDTAIALDRKDTSALLARGKLLEIMGHDDRASADYSAVLAMETASAEALARRGALRLKSDKPAVLADALADLTEARRLDGRDPAILRLLAKAELRTNHNAEAAASFSALLSQTPDDSEARRGRATAYGRLGNFDGAIADLDVVLRALPGDVDALKARGVAALKADRFAPATSDFTTVLAHKPKDAEALFFRATARFRGGDVAGALADFDAVLALHSKDPDALAGRGLARVTAGDLANAEADFSAVLATEPKAVTVLTYRGQLRLLRGDYAGALKDLTSALALSSASPEIAVWRAVAERRLGAKDNDWLAEARGKFATKDWPVPAARYFLGEITARDLAASATSDTETCDAGYFLGEAALARGDRSEALKQFTAATATTARGSFAYIGAKVELAKLIAAK